MIAVANPIDLNRNAISAERSWRPRHEERGMIAQVAVRAQLFQACNFCEVFLALCSRLPATLYIFWSP